MLRIFFTGEDIARTRLVAAPDPLWEITLSLHLLQNRQAEPTYGHWRRRVLGELRGSALRPRVRQLFRVNPGRGNFPDFLTPLAGAQGLEAGLEAVRSTPVALLERDIVALADEHGAPPGAAELARGDVPALTELTDAMRDYFDLALAPYWPRVEAAVEGDRARRLRAVAMGGTQALMESLRPRMRWRDGELAVDYPVDHELHLDGRGLLLVPSYFCWRYPVTLLNALLPPVLVYPIDPLPTPQRPGPDHRALGSLLGTTRAAILAAIGGGCSTGELARRVRVSPAAASQHATVLRQAGLIVSTRDRNHMVHTVTPLGQALLNGA